MGYQVPWSLQVRQPLRIEAREPTADVMLMTDSFLGHDCVLSDECWKFVTRYCFELMLKF
jgi:hypothetical protein